MKGIIHVICQDGREYWIDGKDVTEMVKSCFSHLYSQKLTIYNNGICTKEIEYALIVEILEATPKAVEIMPNEKKDQDKLLDRILCDFSLKGRTLNILSENNILTVRDLVRLHKIDAINFNRMGRKTFIELDDFIKENNLNWGMNV